MSFEVSAMVSQVPTFPLYTTVTGGVPTAFGNSVKRVQTLFPNASLLVQKPNQLRIGRDAQGRRILMNLTLSTPPAASSSSSSSVAPIPPQPEVAAAPKRPREKEDEEKAPSDVVKKGKPVATLKLMGLTEEEKREKITPFAHILLMSFYKEKAERYQFGRNQVGFFDQKTGEIKLGFLKDVIQGADGVEKLLLVPNRLQPEVEVEMKLTECFPHVVIDQKVLVMTDETCPYHAAANVENIYNTFMGRVVEIKWAGSKKATAGLGFFKEGYRDLKSRDAIYEILPLSSTVGDLVETKRVNATYSIGNQEELFEMSLFRV